MSKERKELVDQLEMERDAEFTALLRDFRSAVTHVAQRELGRARPAGSEWMAAARRRERRSLTLAWSTCAAVVCAAVLCAVLLPGYLGGHRSASSEPTAVVATVPGETAATRQAASGAESDSVLLEDVDTDVSASVPPSLAPLVVMEEWDSASADTSSASATNGTPLNQTENTNVAH